MDKDNQIIPFPNNIQLTQPTVQVFNRDELNEILRIYGFMVAAGEWRDYAIDFLKQEAVFSVFKRSSDRPQFKIIKNPSLRKKQGTFRIEGHDGQIIKRHQDIKALLNFFNRKLMKIVH